MDQETIDRYLEYLPAEIGDDVRGYAWRMLESASDRSEQDRSILYYLAGMRRLYEILDDFATLLEAAPAMRILGVGRAVVGDLELPATRQAARLRDLNVLLEDELQEQGVFEILRGKDALELVDEIGNGGLGVRTLGVCQPHATAALPRRLI
jgi:hypothetical protein